MKRLNSRFSILVSGRNCISAHMFIARVSSSFFDSTVIVHVVALYLNVMPLRTKDVMNVYSSCIFGLNIVERLFLQKIIYNYFLIIFERCKVILI